MDQRCDYGKCVQAKVAQVDKVTSDNASVGNADRGGPACFADSSTDQSEFARVFSQESPTLTCTDPTATTPREEALQQCLPETERNLPAPASAPVNPNPNLALATSLVKTGGSGTAEDAKLVAQSLAKLPKSTLEQMQKNGTKVIACRGSVTDYRTDLKGVHPREWPPGKTWDKVPGANNNTRNEVVIAVIGHDTPAGPHVPKTGEGHGSVNMVAHEATHSIDRGSPSPSQSDDFTKAREADMDKLSKYEKQDGVGGPQETYAESAARHAEGKDQDTPHLKKYWDDHQ
jgi:hypothetical protein